MAVLTHTVSVTYKDDAGTVSTTLASYTDTVEVNVTVAVPASTTNQLVNVNFPVANLQSCELSASTALTVKTNSSGAPQETISLVAGNARIYTHDGAAGNPVIPFGGAITAFYLSNATAGSCNFTFRALFH